MLCTTPTGLLLLLATQEARAALTPASLSRAWIPHNPTGPTGDGTTPTSADCHESFFEQPLDHFAADNTIFFKQRFFWNDTFFQPNGPILYYTGNEADVTLYVNATGLMWENAEQLGALLVFGEHRYYGDSLPFSNFSPSNPDPKQLQWLSVEQSLSDHAALVTHLKATMQGCTTSTKVVAIGGSYGGMQSAWARMSHPTVFSGAIAGSAPILAFVRNFSFVQYYVSF
jgi:lysosomal Pro-X carboxypeptidase